MPSDIAARLRRHLPDVPPAGNRALTNLSSCRTGTLPASLRLIVPGHGAPGRTAQLLKSLDHVQSQVQSVGIAYSCVVYVYSPLVAVDASGRLGGCEVHRHDGLWTHHLLHHGVGSGSYVALMLDDMDMRLVRVPAFLSLMRGRHLDAASAAIPDWRWSVMRPKKKCGMHATKFIDPLFVVYSPSAFRCFLSLIDPHLDPSGWGVAYVYARHCNATMGVLDEHLAGHRGEWGFRRKYSSSDAAHGMRAYLRHHWELSSEQEVSNARFHFEHNFMWVKAFGPSSRASRCQCNVSVP